jgi:tryptophanyl-tRNA synthetase
MAQKRILTGDRPTGKYHLGHYVGSIANRLRLQSEYECYFIIADLHTLTTKPNKAEIQMVEQNIRDMVIDQLACGLDPEKVKSVQASIEKTNDHFRKLADQQAGGGQGPGAQQGQRLSVPAVMGTPVCIV